MLIHQASMHEEIWSAIGGLTLTEYILNNAWYEKEEYMALSN